LIAIIPIAAGAYVATNLDNFILLVSLLARYRDHTANVVAGYFVCVLILGFTGYWIGAAATSGGLQMVFMTALISQLGNGADTVVIFSILFTDSKPSADVLILLTLAAMAVIFVVVGIYAVRHPALSKWVDRYAQRAMPFVLIIVGVYVLANTASDLMPD